MYKLVFSHGYAVSKEFWNPIIKALNNKYQYILLDRGYYSKGPITNNAICNTDKNCKLIAIGHSMGFSDLMARKDIEWAGAISIAGFFFLSNHHKSGSLILGTIFNVIKAFIYSPLTVLNSFYQEQKCLSFAQIRHKNTSLLQRDWEVLKSVNVLDIVKRKDIPILHLVDPYDELLVEKSMSKFYDNAIDVEIPYSGHALGLTNVERCVEEIERFIDNLRY